ncbi:MAG TPA: SDR family oxidoreductase [Burkholderiales bacterium]|jgi:nucleoside-diphosphate-sugar epimerase|nr:SDR family oxidoreductase [Burkholderiales bacterium]
MRRLLIIGCGDVGLRMVRALRGRWRIYALTHSESRHALLRAEGIVPVAGDLDRPETLDRLAGLAQDVVHFAPPPGSGTRDARTANLVRALAKGGSLPQRMVYISTSGVYGDCGGAVVDETRRTKPSSDRARRRLDAERQLRAWGAETGVHVSILRVPGIYAAERLPLARLEAGTPALKSEQDPYTNHIHADDLARTVMAALSRGRGGRAYNASDDSWMKMGDFFDLVADQFGLPHPPRISREAAEREIPEGTLSFMRESRRLANRRLKKELRVRLRYPSVAQGVVAARARSA